MTENQIHISHSKNNRYAIGADIGGSHICSAVVDLAQGTICSEPVDTPVNSEAGATEILNAWVRNIERSLALAPGGGDSILGIGFAFPGPFDYVRGISLIRGVRKFDRIYGLDVAKSLRARLDLESEFRFVNDASAFALGECLGGAARGDDRVVSLTLGTGVGSGFVENCRLVESGEQVPANGWVYCLPFEEGIVDDAFSTRWFRHRWMELTGRQAEGVRDIAASYDTDPAARRLFDEYGSRLAYFAGPVLERFETRTLLLGGNIARAYPLFGPAMKERFSADGRTVEIRISSLMDRAAMIGAASLFL